MSGSRCPKNKQLLSAVIFQYPFSTFILSSFPIQNPSSVSLLHFCFLSICIWILVQALNLSPWEARQVDLCEF